MVDVRIFFVDGIKIYHIKVIKEALAVTPQFEKVEPPPNDA